MEVLEQMAATKNAYNESYNTYVDDPFVTTKWSADYGKKPLSSMEILISTNVRFIIKGYKLGMNEMMTMFAYQI